MVKQIKYEIDSIVQIDNTFISKDEYKLILKKKQKY